MRARLAHLCLVLALASGCGQAASLPSIGALVETASVRSPGDAADDPAIWVNPADPALSTVIGTDRRGGLGVYDLEGRELQFVTGAPADNVDLREIVVSGQRRSLVVSTGWDDRALHLYLVDPATRTLSEVGIVKTGVAAAGLCLYVSAVSGTVYAFAMSEEGTVEQWELAEAGGRFTATLARGPWTVGGETEGCVADDALGRLYVGEEAWGVWRYGAEPGQPTAERTGVDDVRGPGRLRPDVEGLALASYPDGTGFLFASSQGDSSFAVYRRQSPNQFLGRFRVDADRVDGCEDTDGIEAATASLGPRFPRGLFVCQDGDNGDMRQNFKLVPLDAILEDTLSSR